MDHQVGQYRAELFDDFVAQLLAAMYPGAPINRKRALRRRHNLTFRTVSIDFQVGLPTGDIVVETKAPYTDALEHVLGSALRRLKTVVDLVSSGRTFIFAIPTALPFELQADFEQIAGSASAKGATVKLWDGNTLRELASEHLGKKMKSFSVDELKQVLGIKVASSSIFTPGPGSYDDVVVLLADFCSYTAFVAASRSAERPELIESVMGRFYRATRQEITDHDGYLDKYMGDGVLAYWFGKDVGPKFDSCVERLMGIAVNLADEWQDEVDDDVEIKGLRAGAAIGNIRFVEENPLNPPIPPIHAIGHVVNVAARLQGKADPNSLVITHLLRKRFFNVRKDFEFIGRVEMKNLKPVRAWKKTFGKDA